MEYAVFIEYYYHKRKTYAHPNPDCGASNQRVHTDSWGWYWNNQW
jgi:hypothetical protein